MTGTTGVVAAVDLGATSGRVMLGYVGENELRIEQVARFANTPVSDASGMHWNIDSLYAAVRAGLTEAAEREPLLSSIGIDSWAVDYALLAGDRMLDQPFHYRDVRSAAGVDEVYAQVGAAELYARNGLQHLPFNTLFQLAADRSTRRLDRSDTLLLIPDLIAFWLTGRRVTERTNASTTGLLDVHSRQWDDELIERIGLDRGLFTELVDAGTTIGPLSPSVAEELRLPSSVTVTAVGSHDTASAVVAVPALTDDFAYISCGTWGLVGVELEAPVLTDEARTAGFTNEGGVDGRVRFLHNVMGLWLLSESVREWERDGEEIDLPALLSAASAVSSPRAVFDANDAAFLAPGDMPARISAWLTEHGLPAPGSRPEIVRSIIESLAQAFADAVETAWALSGSAVSVIHIVGGGSQNALLCQLTADRSGLPVLAGPVEATAIGNILVQARAAGSVEGSLEKLRSLVAHTFPPQRFEPAPR